MPIYAGGRKNGNLAQPLFIGDVMPSEKVAEIIASDHPEYAVEDAVAAQIGSRTHSVSDGDGLRKLDPALAPVTTGLGVLGMPGFTAYVGLILIGRFKSGETMVVAASGPAGLLAGQLANLAGARVVGIAGGPKKCYDVWDDLGFKVCIDHRDPDSLRQLEAACPGGIDVHYEAMSGLVWWAVLPVLLGKALVRVAD
jgi:NADPH-dependent curcumin reductase CurA